MSRKRNRFMKLGSYKSEFYKPFRALHTVTKYDNLSQDTKMLYILLRASICLSKDDPKFRDEPEIFSTFSPEEVAEMLNIPPSNAMGMFTALENVGLISQTPWIAVRPHKKYVHPPLTQRQYHNELTKKLEEATTKTARKKLESDLKKSETRLKEIERRTKKV